MRLQYVVCLLLSCLFFLSGSSLGERYQHEIDPANLTSESVGEFLKGFEGSISKVKAKNSKGREKTTESLEVRGDREGGGFVWGECVEEGLAARRLGPPYSTLVFAFLKEGGYPSKKEIRRFGVSCMDQRVGGLGSSPDIRVSDTKIYLEGSELGKLYVITYGRTDGSTYADQTRKIGP